MKARPPGYRRVMRVLLIVVLAAVACAAAPAATAPTLAGRVTVASSQPQCSPKGCGAPLAPVTLRFARNGRVRSVTTGPAGTFRAWLPGGTYRVSTSQAGAAISPVRVTVRGGATRRVTFVLRLNAA